MTLKDLSEQTQLSAGFLSQLERGLTAIATDSLARIAQALGVNSAYFFLSHTKNRNYILRSYEKEVYQVDNSRFIHYHLTNNIQDKNLLPSLIELLPINCDEEITTYPHEGEEFIYVLEGTLTLFINQEQTRFIPRRFGAL